ncbi:MAG: fimbrillin family protein [Bacteroides sp.]|nr:fimbrillin family protein [Bacteroides sp.]
MKLSNLLYAGMLSSLALVSCTDNDENSEWTGSEGVVFTTSIQSRVSGNSWNANDEVGIFMTPNGSEIASATAANKKYLAQTNGSLVAAPGEGVYLPATGKVDFIAYYPYSNALSGNVMDVNVADQSKPGAIDLLYSNETKGVEAANGKTIALKFVRKMSKITLDMTKDETIESFEGLKVEMKGIATEGKFDLAKGTVKATDGKNTQAVAMNIGNVEAHTAMATAIILPTAAATDQTKMDLTFTLAGKTFTHSIADLTAFGAGKNVTFKATLSINNGKPVVTVGNATIEDWVGVAGGDFDVNFDGEGGGTQPGEEKVLLDESFATSQGAFTIKDVVKPSALEFVWKWSQFKDKKTQEVKDSYMKASAHINKPTPVDYATESWLISPELDLTTATTATLTFDHAVNFAKDMQTQQTLWVKEVGTENWEQVTIATYPAGNSWDFISSGNIDLSAQKGKKVQLGFKYVSTDQGAATWEIKNVKVVADGKGGTVDPTPEPEPEPEPQPQPTPSGTELYISEYVEGSSNNKYIEIYNPTDKAIDLSVYALDLNSNGGAQWSKETGFAKNNYVKLEGTIEAKATKVYKHSQATIYTGEAIDCNAVNFNGNDPIGLFKNDILIDIIGKFAGGNADFAKDVTLRRKADAAAPSATYDENQWEKAGKDDVTGLGKR